MGCTESSTKDATDPNQASVLRKLPKPTEEKRITNYDETFMDLQVQIRKIKDKEKLMEGKIEDAKNNALINLRKKDKKKALFALKLKRLYEATLDKNYGAILMLEKAEQNLRGAQQDSEIYKVMKTANDLTTELQSKVSISDFENLSDK